MRYCENCGAALADGARCCSQCGRPVPEAETEPRDYWAERLRRDRPETEEEKPGPSGKKSRPVPEITVVAPEPRRSGKTGLLITLILALILAAAGGIMAFVWFGKSTPACQRYEGRTCRQGDLIYPGQGDYVELYPDGEAKLFLMGTEGEGIWTRDRGQLTLTLPGRILEGQEENGCLILHFEDMQFLLAEDGVTQLPELTQAPPEMHFEHWAEDYYGWWKVTEAWGQWEENAGLRWDACGRIWMEGEDRGKLELWDTQCGPDELFCAADLTFTPGLTEAGCLHSGEGLFCGIPMEEEDWNLDPGREPYDALPELLVLSGTCRREDSGFSYRIFLRPWGRDWEDVKRMPAGLLPPKDRLPRGYGDWYLPRLAEQKGMPEGFGGANPENWK